MALKSHSDLDKNSIEQNSTFEGNVPIINNH